MSNLILEPSPGPEWAQHFFVGLLIVASFATRRFDAPPAAYTYTTRFRYWIGLVLYTAIPIAVYTALAATFIASPVVLAVFTCVIVYIPPASWIDNWWRPRVHRAIGAPYEAKALGDALFNADIRPPNELDAEVKSALARRGYDPEEPWLPIAEPIRKIWLKTAVLFHQVRLWEHDKGYGAFVRSARSEFDGLREHFDHLSLKVSRVLLTLEHLGALVSRFCSAEPRPSLNSSTNLAETEPMAEEHVRLIIADLLADLRQEICFYMRDLCFFTSRGVLRVGLTPRSRRTRLLKLGFVDIPSATSAVGALTLAYAAWILIFVIAMSLPALFPTLGPPTSGEVQARVLLGVMIATMQLAAILVAVLPKTAYGFANEDIHGHAPRVFLFLAGLAAAAVGALIQMLFIQGIPADLLPNLHTSDRYRWLVMPATTAGMIAFLMQDSRWRSLSRPFAQRLADAAVMAATTVASLLAVFTIGSSPSEAFPRGVVVAIIVGLVTGLVVPAAFRQRHPVGGAACEAANSANIARQHYTRTASRRGS